MSQNIKKKGFAKRLLALLLCCLIICASLPMTAFAAQEETTVSSAVEEEVPVSSSVEEAEETDETQKLFEQLMACTTYEEMEAMMNELTEEQLAAFTEEQNAALTEKVEVLGGYETDLMDEKVTIEAGQTQTVTITSRDWNFSDWARWTENVPNGMTATVQTNGKTATITITVGANVKPGSYKMEFHYYYSGSYIEHVTNIYITVPEQTTTDLSGSALLKHEIDHCIVMYAHYIPGTGWTWSEEYGSDFDVTIERTENDASVKNYYVFFVKPQENYLQTVIRNKGYKTDPDSASWGNLDLYSISVVPSAGNIKDYPNLSSIIATAKAKGYVAYFGYHSNAVWKGYTFLHQYQAVQPTLEVEATPSKTDAQIGETVDFTITLTPEAVSGSTVSSLSVTNGVVLINGVEYAVSNLKKNSDQTYSCTVKDYIVTKDDWLTGSVVLEASASVTYDYSISLKDRDGVYSNVPTTATVSNDGMCQVQISDPYGVVYELQFDAPEGVTPPSTIPAAPVDTNRYPKGNWVTVKDYNTADVDDPTNGGTWTFDGWKVGGGGNNYGAGDLFQMPEGGIKFVGVWKFEAYKTATVVVTKKVSGNMAEKDQVFDFYIERNGASRETFTLKDGQSKTFTVNVNEEIKVYEERQHNGTSHGYTTQWVVRKPDHTLVKSSLGAAAEFKAESANITYTVTCTNTKEIKVDTGVFSDFLPYALLLGTVTMVGAAVLLRKKRRENE